MRTAYSLILYLLVPVVLLRLLFRSVKLPGYRKRIAERFAFFSGAPERVVWVHAVSVGETIAASPVINALLKQNPDQKILLTTSTPTGSAQALEIFGERILHVYAPYDLPTVVKRFLKHFDVSLLVVMETEIWPNLFYQCHQHHIPVLLANARLSEKSMQGYLKLASLSRATVRCITRIAAQSEADAERFIKLGADKDKVSITGSIKFDLNIEQSLRESADVLRRELGINRKIWIAASTHEGEEALLLNILTLLQSSEPDLLLMLVPRHPDRFDKVATFCEKRGFTLVRRSHGASCDQATRIYLGDSMGELLLMYAAADIAFVGGSLVAVGGHNLLEPAALGLPVVTGPYLFNFADISQRLQEVNGMLKSEDADQLASNMEMLLRDDTLRQKMGENARLFVEQNRGSLEKLLELIYTLH